MEKPNIKKYNINKLSSLRMYLHKLNVYVNALENDYDLLKQQLSTKGLTHDKPKQQIDHKQAYYDKYINDKK